MAIEPGSARIAPVGAPRSSQQREEDRQRQQEVHQVAGYGDDRQDDHGTPGRRDQLAVADYRPRGEVHRRLEPAVRRSDP